MRRWTSSVPNFNLIHWKKTVPQWWEPTEIHCLSQAEPWPQPCSGLRRRRAASQPCRYLGKRGGRLLLRPVAGAAAGPLPRQHSHPCARLWGQSRPCFTWALLSPPFTTLPFRPDGNSGVGIQLQPKGSKSFCCPKAGSFSRCAGTKIHTE